MSDADILPTYSDLGIADRQVAADALKVAKIEEHIFQGYIETDEPTLSGLFRFVAHQDDPDEIIGWLMADPAKSRRSLARIRRAHTR